MLQPLNQGPRTDVLMKKTEGHDTVPLMRVLLKEYHYFGTQTHCP
jgi:hypothetical protein